MSDPLAVLYELKGVQVAWCQSMPWSVLWLPEESGLVLNAQMPRAELAVEALKLVTPDDLGVTQAELCSSARISERQLRRMRTATRPRPSGGRRTFHSRLAR